MIQYNTTQYNTTQHNTTKLYEIHHITTQNNKETKKQNTTQHNTNKNNNITHTINGDFILFIVDFILLLVISFFSY